MGRFLLVSVMVLAASALLLRAEDAGVAGRGAGGTKPAEAKAGETKAAESKAAEVKPAEAGVEATKTGTLAEKPVNAATDVVAVLQVKSTDKKQERKNRRTGGGAEETVNLTATGDVATKIADLLKKSATVEVTGTLSGGTMKVASITEKTDEAAGKKGKEGRRKKNQ